jgi:hypothetical protein
VSTRTTTDGEGINVMAKDPKRKPHQTRTRAENARLAAEMRRLVPLLREDQKRLPSGI